MSSHALKHEPLDAYNLALTENLHPAEWALTAVGFIATVAVAVHATRIGARALREKT